VRNDPDELLTVAAAAKVAKRSVRTIRRAYRCGALTAHRDGNGRTVRIRYDDLRRWMMAKPVAPPRLDDRPTGEIRHRKRRANPPSAPSRNRRLLNAVRQRAGA
jgi:excisionase family DNA binding protein